MGQIPAVQLSYRPMVATTGCQWPKHQQALPRAGVFACKQACLLGLQHNCLLREAPWLSETTPSDPGQQACYALEPDLPVILLV